ncbi:uncharacterized protein LOC141828209 [Curcuma longa]|uniref:uncharacterized protein LOC141828209 n=1 Tax=Curcuma longa TaxID=136217 RepID=UPI003D9E02B9
MPGLLMRCAEFSEPARSPSRDSIWSRHRDSISFDQLEKFWSELSLQARKEFLRLDKQALFEHARRNLYCSRCNGLLLEAFSQIINYGKSMQQGGSDFQLSDRAGNCQSQGRSDVDEVQDPSSHPWGGLTTTKHGPITVLDCFVRARSLKSLQKVFDSARVREHERELLYPDACGGGARGWISQGMANYGKGHGSRETCALHTARLSCETLVDFWSALGEETRLSLLRMKEEDFIERLMYRFDSKKFCRDCRRNVIREFKELKELKRLHKEPCCTRWFCVADSAFQYQVTEDTVQADWHQSFTDADGAYHHFEWAIGTGEGQTDILGFEDVGLNGRVQVTGLDLGGFDAFYITLRAWKLDGRCTELSVKAHGLKGQDCVHHRLIVGDGFVTITEGDNIRNFFEHAEEADEEEDDDAMEKDGNELDRDSSQSQKHAKSPELAREFLLDAATVIFKEQVEKAFREGTTRQNAHCIFVCLALKLLEERLHVGCKEVITLEKQTKLLEEEEKEKREEEERKERKKTKEREKKLRRKERLKEKGREKEKKLTESKSHDSLPADSSISSISSHDESLIILHHGDSVDEDVDSSIIQNPDSLDNMDEKSSGVTVTVNHETVEHQSDIDGNLHVNNETSSACEYSKSSGRKPRPRKNYLLGQASNWFGRRCCYNAKEISNQQDKAGIHLCSSRGRGTNSLHRPSKERFAKHNHRSCNPQKERDQDRFVSMGRLGKEIKIANKPEYAVHMPRLSYQNAKYGSGYYSHDNFSFPKGKHVINSPGKEIFRKQVWEPLDAQRKVSRNHSDPQLTSITCLEPSQTAGFVKGESGCQQHTTLESVSDVCLANNSTSSGELGTMMSCDAHVCHDNLDNIDTGTDVACQDKLGPLRKKENYLKNDTEEDLSPAKITSSDPVRSSSSSDNCFSCPSEGDSSTSSSSGQNAESSVTSDSEDASQQSCGGDASIPNNDFFQRLSDEFPDNKGKANGDDSFSSFIAGCPSENCLECDYPVENSVAGSESYSGQPGYVTPPIKHMLPGANHSMNLPYVHSPAFGYHTWNLDPWQCACNGFMTYPQANHYLLPNHLGYRPWKDRHSDFTIHYGPVQPVALSVFDANKELLYQTTNRMNLGTFKEQKGHDQSCGFQQSHSLIEPIGHRRSVSNRQVPSKPLSAEKGIGEHCAKPNSEHPSFSLFHYGGPVDANTAGFNGKSHPLKDETTGGIVSNLSTTQGQACSKEEIEVEEYCLFSSRYDAKFSFF